MDKPSHQWINRLNYDDIAIVVTIAEKGSFTAAAKALGIPSSTLSRRLSEFENQLQIRLFERSTRSIRLTRKGEELVNACSAQVHALQQTLQTLASNNDSLSATLRLSLPQTLGIDLISLCFSSFIQQHPGIKLELDLNNDYAELLQQNIDLAIRVGPLKNSEMIAQALFHSDMVLCASPRFVQQYAVAADNIQSLANKPYLAYLDSPENLPVKHHSTSLDFYIPTQVHLASNNTLALKAACCQGLGFACLPKISVQQELDQGELLLLFSGYQFFEAKTVYAVYPSKTHLPKHTRIFIEHIRNVMTQP